MLLAPLQGQANLNLTLALKVVRTEAKHDDIVSERMQHWTQVFRSAVAGFMQRTLASAPAAGHTKTL